MNSRRKQELARRKKRRRARRRFFFRAILAAAVCVALFFAVRTGWSLLQGRLAYSPERLAEEGYPESLIELLEKNPEARDFVLDYPDYEGLQEIDISGEVVPGEIPLFLQWDERWGYEKYGSDYGRRQVESAGDGPLGGGAGLLRGRIRILLEPDERGSAEPGAYRVRGDL